MATLMAVSAKEYYDILAIDSAKYNSIMTANFISYMELEAFMVSKKYQCKDKKNNVIADRESKKVAMPEIFNVLAGSETGAVIASTLNVPNQDVETMDVQDNAFFID
jgi:hypothetical protein